MKANAMPSCNWPQHIWGRTALCMLGSEKLGSWSQRSLGKSLQQQFNEDIMDQFWHGKNLRNIGAWKAWRRIWIECENFSTLFLAMKIGRHEKKIKIHDYKFKASAIDFFFRVLEQNIILSHSGGYRFCATGCRIVAGSRRGRKTGFVCLVLVPMYSPPEEEAVNIFYISSWIMQSIVLSNILNTDSVEVSARCKLPGKRKFSPFLKK